MSNVFFRPRIALWLLILLTTLATTHTAFANQDSSLTDSSAIALANPTPAHLLFQSNSMKVKVSSVDKSTEKLASLFDKFGVSIVREETNKVGQVREAIWVAQIEKGKLNDFIKTVKSTADLVLSQGANFEEKIAQLLELDKHIAYQKETLDEISALAEKAHKPSEQIEARVALRNIEAELQQLMESRVKLLNEAELVTITITFVEDTTIVAADPSFKDQMLSAFLAGIDNLKGTLLLIVTYWPITIAAIVALLYFSLAIRHNKRIAENLRKQREFEQDLKRSGGPII